MVTLNAFASKFISGIKKWPYHTQRDRKLPEKSPFNEFKLKSSIHSSTLTFPHEFQSMNGEVEPIDIIQPIKLQNKGNLTYILDNKTESQEICTFNFEEAHFTKMEEERKEK